VKRIYRFSGGIPRLINVACERALVMAWTRESLAITPYIAAQVIAEAGAAAHRRGLWERIAGLFFPGK
jgi:general secretion pathway protein A